MNAAPRVAWVTGGGTGIGKALSLALGRSGYAVAISGRRADVLNAALPELLAVVPYQRALAVPCDVSDRSQVVAAGRRIKEAFGDVTLLINNAGWNPNHSFTDTPAEEFEKSFAINCMGAVYATQTVLPGMLAVGEGAIVNVGSVLGHWASAGSAAYSVAKYAVTGLTDIRRQDLVGKPVHVMGVYPGYVETAMTQPFVEQGSWKARIGRSPEKMAAAVVRALERRKPELYYPFYVPWVLRLHRWMPLLSARLARRVKK